MILDSLKELEVMLGKSFDHAKGTRVGRKAVLRVWKSNLKRSSLFKNFLCCGKNKSQPLFESKNVHSILRTGLVTYALRKR